MSTIDDDDDDYDYESDRILSENRIKYEIPFSEAIRADDREAFVRLCENYYESFYDTIRLGDIWSICRVGAVNCASALFESPDTIPLIDLNAPPRELRGHYPLIVASLSFSYDVVDLLLRHGARTDLVATGYEWKTADIPLKQVLVDMLDYHAYLIDWNPKKSIYTLVTILCLPQMIDADDDCYDDDDYDYDYESDRLLSEYTKKYQIPFSEAIRADDREAFVRLCENYYDSPRSLIRLHDIWSICRVGAVNCASALFESPDTFPLIDVNAPRELRGHYPLIVASLSFCYDVVDLLLRHGARTDLVATGYEWETADIPLKQVLDMLLLVPPTE